MDRPDGPEHDLDATLRALPKVLLHDHLDGGVRPATVVELSAEVGHALPTTDPDALGRWFVEAAASGSLPRYLETFEHTLAVMQTADGLRRVAREAALDLAADGVVHAEQRYAPEQHQRAGLTLQQVVDAVREGFAEGEAQARAQGHEIRVVQVLSAMRQADRADEIAALALANRDAGVVGFDIAGPEDGFLPSLHASAFRTVREASFPATVHAGEDGGLDSMADALHVAGALRLGHGVRIADDVRVDDDGTPHLGRLAHWVRDRRVPLEVCPSSNLQTGAAASVATHPVTTLLRAGFEVTVNTDNRLQSGTSLSRELGLLVREAGWTLDDVLAVTVTAARHTFLHEDERRALVDRIVRPARTSGTVSPGRHRA
ncbi:adenosine deaminase [Cellulomonas sp. B6]|uniref:adenosine deaminase n=1 Tax=Cellulomonas sp. B6 TaxID=1295626 RepID=UPI00073C8DB2|nr:adenosine deaminase [Cellulomonas sp. B6]